MTNKNITRWQYGTVIVFALIAIWDFAEKDYNLILPHILIAYLSYVNYGYVKIINDMTE